MCLAGRTPFGATVEQPFSNKVCCVERGSGSGRSKCTTPTTLVAGRGLASSIRFELRAARGGSGDDGDVMMSDGSDEEI